MFLSSVVFSFCCLHWCTNYWVEENLIKISLSFDGEISCFHSLCPLWESWKIHIRPHQTIYVWSYTMSRYMLWVVNKNLFLFFFIFHSITSSSSRSIGKRVEKFCVHDQPKQQWNDNEQTKSSLLLEITYCRCTHFN